MARSTGEQIHFAGEVGVVAEKSGIPRMAGKILGLLLITERPHLSAEEIARTLQASRGSVSTMTRLLIQLGLADRVTEAGKRQDFYRVNPEGFSHLLRSRMAIIGEFGRIIEHGIGHVHSTRSDAHRRLIEMRDLYALFERELSAFVMRWEEQCRASEKK